MLRRSTFALGAVLLGAVCISVFALPASAGAGVYFVKQGDTLTSVSRVFAVDVESIRAANRLRSDMISPGDRLRIPEAPARPRPAPEASRQRELSADRVLQAVCRDETVYHPVAKGDTLFAIANRYDTELDSLLQLNGLNKKSRLAIGQRIVVRKSGPRSHTVGRGETLSRIAKRYGIETATLARLNRLEGTTIIAGQRLLIEPCDPYAAAGSAPPPLVDAPNSATLAAKSDAPPAAALAQPALAEDSVAGAAPAAALAQRVINLARTMLNVPYRFGGSTLRGIDCSAYVQRVFGLMDVAIPRTAREQFRVGASVDRDDIQTGDLVFFRTYASFPSHVGIYLGDNLFIHASSMVRKVAVDSMDRPYYRKRFIGARRLIDSAPAVASTP